MHDLRLRYLAPTVNLSISTTDFVKMLGNIDYYSSLPIAPAGPSKYGYPVGLLGDIEINFVHYQSFDLAKAKWEERVQRINYSNLFIIVTDNDGCTEEVIQRFEELPYENKVLFTTKLYHQYEHTFCIRGFEDKPCVGDLTLYRNMLGKKYYDDFDYVLWLNKGM